MSYCEHGAPINDTVTFSNIHGVVIPRCICCGSYVLPEQALNPEVDGPFCDVCDKPAPLGVSVGEEQHTTEAM